MNFFRSLKAFLLFTFITFIFTISSGCASVKTGNNNIKNNENELDPDPITIKVHFGPDEHFIERFTEPAEDEFTHITFEYVEGDLEELIAAQNVPDILWFWDQGWMEYAGELELAYDMTELINQTGFNIERFDENHLAEWQAYSNGEIWSLPLSTDRFALMYNKDIFDQFGVPYPEDGLSWKDLIEIGRKVSGEINGVEYYGLYMPKAGGPFNWTAGHFVDPETDEPLWTSSEVIREYFELYKEAYSIPGNPYMPEHWEEGGWPELFAQGKLAMAPHWLMRPDNESSVNWDIATYPEPINGVPAGGWSIGISSTSEHKEEVLKVFDFWFSDEQILENTFIGGPLSLPFAHLYDNGLAVEKALELEGDVWEDRNMEALFSLPVAESPSNISKYSSDEAINDALYEYVHDDSIDFNSLMRKKHEEEVARIASMKEQE